MPKKVDSGEVTRIEIETFQHPYYKLYNLGAIDAEPSCFNGDVRARKWKIVAEVIDEPVDVICARLQHLWEMCDNMHHYGPLTLAFEKLGRSPVGSFGAKRIEERRRR